MLRNVLSATSGVEFAMMKTQECQAARRLSWIGVALSLAIAAGSAAAGPIENLQPGQWYRVPNSTLRTVVPVPTPAGDPANVINAWSGGTFDTRRDRLLVWGGGHADYGGNEIYAFEIATLAWARIWGPSPLSAIQAQWLAPCLETYLDGNPVARHTYGGLAYDAQQDAMMAYGGSLFCGPGNGGNDTWAFEFGNARWQKKAYVSSCATCGGLGASLAYDPVSGHVWLAGVNYNLGEYNPATNQWTLRYTGTGIGYGMTGTIDTKRRKFVFVGQDGVKMYDLNATGTIPRQNLTTTGATAMVGAKFPGVAYDPVSDRIVAWAGGGTLYLLNMDTLVWTRNDPAPSNTVIPPAQAEMGTYGRFQYIPSKNAFVVVSSIDQDVYIRKLSAGSGSPSDSIPPSVPASFRPR